MIEGGWVKLHRRLMDWEWYHDSQTVHLLIHCIMRANHQEGRWMGEKILRGQFISGRKKLSTETGISEKGIRTRLERLQNSGELAIKTARRYSIITVCNYEEYQEKEKESGQVNGHRPASKGPANGQLTATNKKKKNNKEQEEIKASGKGSSNHEEFADWLVQ